MNNRPLKQLQTFQINELHQAAAVKKIMNVLVSVSYTIVSLVYH